MPMACVESLIFDYLPMVGRREYKMKPAVVHNSLKITLCLRKYMDFWPFCVCVLGLFGFLFFTSNTFWITLPWQQARCFDLLTNICVSVCARLCLFRTNECILQWRHYTDNERIPFNQMYIIWYARIIITNWIALSNPLCSTDVRLFVLYTKTE